MAAASAKTDGKTVKDKRKPDKAGGRRNPAGLLLWTLVGGLAAASFALPTVLLLAVGMVPSLVAWIVDQHRDGYTPMAVGMLNLAGLLPSLLGLWTGGHDLGAAARIMSDSYTWLFAFGAAGVGWALALGLPKVIETAMTIRNETEINRLKARQASLVAEWGPEVTGKTPSDG